MGRRCKGPAAAEAHQTAIFAVVSQRSGVIPALGRRHPLECRRLTSEFAIELSASPSGRFLAYTAGEGHGTVLRLMSLRDGTTSTLVHSANACHPTWSSDSTVWTSVRNGGELSWIEFDIEQRRPTGRSKPGTTPCFDGQSDPAAPVAGPVRIENHTDWDVRVQPVQRDLARAPQAF